jgi:starch synthase
MRLSLVVAALCFVPLAALADSFDVLLLSPEQTSILQTGGLAHATTGLARAFNDGGYTAGVLMPGYSKMNAGPLVDTGRRYTAELDWWQGKPRRTSHFALLKQDPNHPSKNGVPTLFLKHSTYPGENNYFDNSFPMGKPYYAREALLAEGFGAFNLAAFRYIMETQPKVIILNDWTMGPLAYLLAKAKARGLKVPKVVFAIHNIAFQGNFPRELLYKFGFDPNDLKVDGFEYYGQLSFLKMGIQYSDRVYTVSGQYAKEITTARFGAGFEGLITKKTIEGKMKGILNGIDVEEWDPMTSVKGLAYSFSRTDLSGKARGKADIQREFGLSARADLPLFVLTSRLTEQKGFEYVIGAIEHMAKEGRSQWIIVGDGGDPGDRYATEFKRIQERFPELVQYRKFSSLNEKKVTRYGDFFVNGAWFEPSGLNQLFALRNGTLPVVSAAGGLLESVKDGVTGLHFKIIEGGNGAAYDTAATMRSAIEAFERAVKLYHDPARFHSMRLKAMAEDNSWSSRVRRYFEPLFEELFRDSPSGEKMSGSRQGVRCEALWGAA